MNKIEFFQQDLFSFDIRVIQFAIKLHQLTKMLICCYRIQIQSLGVSMSSDQASSWFCDDRNVLDYRLDHLHIRIDVLSYKSCFQATHFWLMVHDSFCFVKGFSLLFSTRYIQSDNVWNVFRVLKSKFDASKLCKLDGPWERVFVCTLFT